MMKMLFSIILSFALIVGLSIEFPQQAEASAVKYKNCTELNKVYKGGVAKDKTVKNKGGKTKFIPHVSEEIYNANTHLDRDKDFIACEK